VTTKSHAAFICPHRTTPEVVVAQWINQSFNAGLNFTNRNANSNVTNKQIGFAYASATSAAVGVSVGVNSLVKVRIVLLSAEHPYLTSSCMPFVLRREHQIL